MENKTNVTKTDGKTSIEIRKMKVLEVYEEDETKYVGQVGIVKQVLNKRGIGYVLEMSDKKTLILQKSMCEESN